MDRVKYYFVSDLHIGHDKIIKFHPERLRVMGISPDDPDALKKHDEWIINKWNETIRRKDSVYILGDFSFLQTKDAERVLQRLNGNKYLVYGNHDRYLKPLTRYFKSNEDIKEVVFRQRNKELDFLEEPFRLEMLHYPMITWQSRLHGACHIHGHVHGNLDKFNKESGELRVDVGFDGELANYGFIELEDLYKYFKKVSGGKLFETYVLEKAERDGIRI